MKKIILDQNPKNNGQIIGENCRKEIQELSAIRNRLITKYLKDFTAEKINDLALAQAEHLKKYPDFYAEFEAIHHAAGISAADLIILNNYTDMRDFSTHGQDEGCTVFSYQSTHPARALAGQTWDMHASARPFMLHLVEKRPGKPQSQMLTLMGCFGLSGINEFGLSIMINNLHSREAKVGLIWCALVRGMLQEKNAQAAHHYLQNNRPCSGHNYLICDPKHSLNIETTGLRDEVSQQISSAQTSFIVHSNHYLSSLKETEMHWRRSKSTEDRLRKAQQFFQDAQNKTLDLNDLATGLLQNSSCTVNVPPPSNDPHGSATCGGVLVNLKEKSGLFYGGEYHEGDHSPIHW